MTGFDPRRQPPVDVPPPRPDRFSQTLLAKHDVCPHDAYLYLTHGGGALSHDLSRGSLFHLFAERAMWTLIENGERRLFALTEGEDPMQAKAQVASLTEAIVDECARAMDPEPPAADVDAVREMAFHWAVGLDVEPDTVAGVEQRFELDVAGQVVVCKVDLLAATGDVLEISDYKTSFDTPSQEELERRFQLKTYGVAVAFGYPTRKVPCEDCGGDGFGGEPERMIPPLPSEPCPICEGRGTVNERLEPIGAGVNYFRLREVYPRYLDKETGLLRSRSFTATRTQLHNFMVDLTRAVERITDRFETGLWPAVPGDKHCGLCTARGLCPLPKHLRSHAGEVETLEQAQEALALVEAQAAQHRAIKTEVRNFARREGVSVRVGRDLVYEFGEESKTVTDYDGLDEAVQRAVQYGEPFEMSAFRRRQSSTPFRRRRLKADEIDGEAAA